MPNTEVNHGRLAASKMISSQVMKPNSTIAGHIHNLKRGYLRLRLAILRTGVRPRRMNQSGIAVHGHIWHHRLPNSRTMKIRPIHQIFQVSTGARFRPGSCEPIRPITITATKPTTTGSWIAGWNHRLFIARASGFQRVSSSFQYTRGLLPRRSNSVKDASKMMMMPTKKASFGIPGIKCTYAFFLTVFTSSKAPGSKKPPVLSSPS
jgi:hypothetical protein